MENTVYESPRCLIDITVERTSNRVIANMRFEFDQADNEFINTSCGIKEAWRVTYAQACESVEELISRQMNINPSGIGLNL